MAVLEAWSYGLPVLMTDACNLEKGFEVNAAIRIEPETKSVAQGLRTLIALSEEKRQAMSKNAVSLVKSDFDWSVCATEMMSVYSWLLGRSQKPKCVRF